MHRRVPVMGQREVVQHGSPAHAHANAHSTPAQTSGQHGGGRASRARSPAVGASGSSIVTYNIKCRRARSRPARVPRAASRWCYTRAMTTRPRRRRAAAPWRRHRASRPGCWSLMAVAHPRRLRAAGRAGPTDLLQAAAKAGFVGGIADWFAVTALFRHPLGMPIPHTAIIPHQKERLGRALGRFVASHVFTAGRGRPRAGTARPRRRSCAASCADPAADPPRRRGAGRDAAPDAGERRGRARAAPRRRASSRACSAAPAPARVVARALRGLVEGGRHQEVFGFLLGQFRTLLANQRGGAARRHRGAGARAGRPAGRLGARRLVAKRVLGMLNDELDKMSPDGSPSCAPRSTNGSSARSTAWRTTRERAAEIGRRDPPGGGARDHPGLAVGRLGAPAHGAGGRRRQAGRAHHRADRGRARQSRHHAGVRSRGARAGCRRRPSASSPACCPPRSRSSRTSSPTWSRAGTRRPSPTSWSSGRQGPAIRPRQRHAGRFPGRRACLRAAPRDIRPCHFLERNPMTPPIRLSVLDQSTVVTGRSPDASIRESLELARHCDALGYRRYWLAEHHNSASIAGTAPEVLISAIAATTRAIRVGSAGVMLPHYSSLKVAEQFRVLEAIAPGRIDLGLGRAPGSDGRTAYALNPHAETAADHFPAQVRDLLSWLAGEQLVEGHPFRDIVAQPARPDRAGDVDSRQLRLRRAGRRVFRAALLLRAFHHRRARRRAGVFGVPPDLPAERAPSRAAYGGLRLGARRRHRGGGRAAVHLARHRPAQPRPRHLLRRCSPPRKPPPSRSAKASGCGSPGCANAPSTAPRPRSARGCGRWPRNRNCPKSPCSPRSTTRSRDGIPTRCWRRNLGWMAD